jgi:hypothetical protein
MDKDSLFGDQSLTQLFNGENNELEIKFALIQWQDGKRAMPPQPACFFYFQLDFFGFFTIHQQGHENIMFFSQ